MKNDKYIKLYDVLFNAEYTNKDCKEKWQDFDDVVKGIKDFDYLDFYEKSERFRNKKGFSKDLSGVTRITNEFPCLTTFGENVYLDYKSKQIEELIQEYKKITSENIKDVLEDFELEAIKKVLDYCEANNIICYDGKVYLYASNRVYTIVYDNIKVPLVYNRFMTKSPEPAFIEYGSLNDIIENEELKKRCLDILLSDGMFDRAINQATQVLEYEIKKKAKLENTKLVGLALISRAIAPKKENTILLFSEEPEIQEAYAFLFKGMMGTYRNPTHHTTNFGCTREDALKCCAFIDYLLKKLSQCEVIERKNQFI